MTYVFDASHCWVHKSFKKVHVQRLLIPLAGNPPLCCVSVVSCVWRFCSVILADRDDSWHYPMPCLAQRWKDKNQRTGRELWVYLIPPAHFTDKLFDTQRRMMWPNQSVIALGWEFHSPGLFPLQYFVNFLLSLYSFQHQAQSSACRKNSVNDLDYWFLELE